MKWEIRVERFRVDERNSGGKIRTVGTYQVYHDGEPQIDLLGQIMEEEGPGDNSHAGNDKCLEPGSYSLHTQDGAHYMTIGYETSDDPNNTPKPGILVGDTGHREGILIHPGHGYLSSIGCLNPCDPTEGPDDLMDFPKSRDRVIAIINDLKHYLQNKFPDSNGEEIPNAHLIISEAFDPTPTS